jgi:hypothetical protein
LGMREIFEADLARHPLLRDKLTASLTSLIDHGSRATVAATLQRIGV